MRKHIYITLFLFFTLLVSSSVVYAADISAVSSQNTISTNQIFTVTIYTDTKGIAINNIDGILSFPQNLLNVNSISTSGSIFSLWVEQPSFSNTNGTVSFNGGIPNPGFTGSKGKVITIVFVAKKAGVAQTLFSSADIYANDGQGTDVVLGKNGTTINITNSIPSTPVKPTVPTTPVKTKVTDTAIVPVNFNVIYSTTENDQLALMITNDNSVTQISKYTIAIDGVFSLDSIPRDNGAYVLLPAQLDGNHQVDVTAYDSLGNKIDKVLTIEFPKIKSPVITSYPKSITKGEKINIQGTSYPDTDIRVWIKTEKEDAQSYMVRSLDDKTFSFTSDPINSTGLVYFWTEALMTSDVISASSDKYFVAVNESSFVKISLQTIEILAVTIPALLLLILLVYLGLHSYYRLKKMRRRLMPDLVKTENEAHKIFKILTEDAKQIVKVFKSKDFRDKLTRDHTDALDTLSKDINEAEDYFAKRIKYIERKDL